MRRKMGWTVNGIVGSIFAPIGLLFTVLALILSQSETVSWRHADGSFTASVQRRCPFFPGIA